VVSLVFVSRAVALFFLNICKRANALAAPLSGSTNWRARMSVKDKCWRLMRGALVIGMLLLSGWAGVGFEAPPSACPQVVD
jgi:hypothetical protein